MKDICHNFKDKISLQIDQSLTLRYVLHYHSIMLFPGYFLKKLFIGIQKSSAMSNNDSFVRFRPNAI